MNRFMTLLMSSALSLPLLAADAPKTLTVNAGPRDRNDAVVAFKLPAGADTQAHWQLRDGTTTLALQAIPGGRAAFVLPNLKAGQARTYSLEPASQRTTATVDARREDDHVTLLTNGQPILRYNGAKTPLPAGFDPSYARGGYIHPVLTPSGVLVSDDYPPNHKHHHGFWSPWTKTQFEGRKPDFWNMGDKTGTVEFVELSSTFNGPVAAGLTTKHRFVDLSAKPGPKTALNETWDIAAYPADKGEKPYFVFDLTSTQTCATDQPLILPKYYYGGLGFRGNRQWDGKDNCQFLTSEGKTRADGNETRGRWVHISGKVDGKVAGLAILSHPDNFRSPQPLRLHPTEPFVCFAPQQLGEFKIEPGKPYTARYRIVTLDGPPDAAMIDRLWNDYATPPEVTLK